MHTRYQKTLGKLGWGNALCSQSSDKVRPNGLSFPRQNARSSYFKILMAQTWESFGIPSGPLFLTLGIAPLV